MAKLTGFQCYFTPGKEAEQQKGLRVRRVVTYVRDKGLYDFPEDPESAKHSSVAKQNKASEKRL